MKTTDDRSMHRHKMADIALRVGARYVWFELWYFAEYRYTQNHQHMAGKKVAIHKDKKDATTISYMQIYFLT